VKKSLYISIYFLITALLQVAGRLSRRAAMVYV